MKKRGTNSEVRNTSDLGCIRNKLGEKITLNHCGLPRSNEGGVGKRLKGEYRIVASPCCARGSFKHFRVDGAVYSPFPRQPFSIGMSFPAICSL